MNGDGVQVVLYDGEINGNTSYQDGGGVYQAAGALFLMNEDLNGNRASNRGGGLFKNNGFATISGGFIRGNSALDPNHGDGVFINATPTAGPAIADTNANYVDNQRVVMWL